MKRISGILYHTFPQGWSNISWAMVLFFWTFATISCGDDLSFSHLKTVEIGFIQLDVPDYFDLYAKQGIDSQVGALFGWKSAIDISYDFGKYGKPFDKPLPDQGVLLTDTLGTLIRQILISEDSMNDLTGVFIIDLNKDSSVKLWTRNLSQDQQALVVKIFKSTRAID